MGDLYLIHHGILGQKWGDRNGPPYPLSAKEHSSKERKAGKSGWSKEAKKESASDATSDKKTFNYKKALKYGAIAVGTGLAAYGGYKLYKSGALNDVVKNGKDIFNKTDTNESLSKILDGVDTSKNNIFEQGDNIPFHNIKNELLNNGYKTSSNKNAIDDFFDINYLDSNRTFGSDTNCVSCATSNALQLMGIKTQAKLNTIEGSNFTVNIPNRRSIAELQLAFKGTEFRKPTGLSTISDVKNELLKNGDGAIGLFRYVTPQGNGHAVTWSVDNGKVKISDSQHANELLKAAINSNIDPSIAKKKIYERLSDIPDTHYNNVDFTKDFGYIRIDNATGIITSVLDSLIIK